MALPYSWALMVRKGNGEKIIKHDGVWMSELQYKALLYRQKRQFELMKLPPELRHNILHLLPNTNYVAVYLPGNHGKAHTRIELPVTARAGDRLLRQETLMMTIEQTTFSIHSGPGNTSFQTWLAGVDLRLTSTSYVNGFDAVKKLEFPYFSRFPHASLSVTTPNSDIELMLKCRQLENVSMVWVGVELHNYDANTRQQLLKSVDQLRGEYRLDRMLGLRKLKTLTMVGNWMGDTTAIENLAAWFSSVMPDVDGRPIAVVLM